jgi:hypothetical protein
MPSSGRLPLRLVDRSLRQGRELLQHRRDLGQHLGVVGIRRGRRRRLFLFGLGRFRLGGFRLRGRGHVLGRIHR